MYSKKHDDSNYQHEIYQPAPEAFYNTFLDRLQSTKTPELLKNTATLNCEWGDGPNYFRFAPQFKAAALPDGEAVTFKNHCFEENTA